MKINLKGIIWYLGYFNWETIDSTQAKNYFNCSITWKQKRLFPVNFVVSFFLFMSLFSSFFSVSSKTYVKPHCDYAMSK